MNTILGGFDSSAETVEPSSVIVSKILQVEKFFMDFKDSFAVCFTLMLPVEAELDEVFWVEASLFLLPETMRKFPGS